MIQGQKVIVEGSSTRRALMVIMACMRYVWMSSRWIRVSAA